MSRLATIIICLLISSLLVFFLLWPEIQKYRDLNLKVKIKNIEIENQSRYFSKIKDTSEKLKSYKEEISKVDFALPDEPDIPSVLEFIFQAAGENGMALTKLGTSSVSSLEKQPSQESGILNKLREGSIEFVVIGDYSSFKNFLTTLERNARLIEVDSVNFTYELTQEETLPSFLVIVKTYSF